MNSNMAKPEKFSRLHLVYHFTVPLSQYEKSIPHLLSFLKQLKLNFLTQIKKQNSTNRLCLLQCRTLLCSLLLIYLF